MHTVGSARNQHTSILRHENCTLCSRANLPTAALLEWSCVKAVAEVQGHSTAQRANGPPNLHAFLRVGEIGLSDGRVWLKLQEFESKGVAI